MASNLESEIKPNIVKFPSAEKDFFKLIFPKISTEIPDQIKYLYFYVKHLGCKSILIEQNYLSSSYLYDYTSYHVYKSGGYSKYTIRYHFFSIDLTKYSFSGYITEDFYAEFIYDIKNTILKDSYIGATVIKPFDDIKKKLGITLLKTYENEKTKSEFNNDEYERIYNSKKIYKINLLGKKLYVDTLILSGQDELSRCATSALFALNHWTSEYFNTQKFYPGQLTKHINRLYGSGRQAIPSSGLSNLQIGGFLQGLRLTFDLILNDELETIPMLSLLEKNNYIKDVIRAYNSSGIPILLGLERKYNKENDTFGLHMVTVTGYRLNHELIPKNNYSEKIDMLYANDDNLGPHASLHFNSEETEEIEIINFKTKINKIIASFDKFDFLIIPLPRGITVRYKELKIHLETLFDTNTYIFDLQLGLSNEIKEKIIQNPLFENKQKFCELLLPKYLWVVSIYDKVSELYGTLIIDTNDDFGSENFLRYIFFHNQAFKNSFLSKNEFLKVNESKYN